MFRIKVWVPVTPVIGYSKKKCCMKFFHLYFAFTQS